MGVFLDPRAGVRAAVLPLRRGSAVGAAGGAHAPGVGPGGGAPHQRGQDAQRHRRLRRLDHARRGRRGARRASHRISGKALASTGYRGHPVL